MINVKELRSRGSGGDEPAAPSLSLSLAGLELMNSMPFVYVKVSSLGPARMVPV